MIVTLKYLQKEVSFSRQILNPLAGLVFKASKGVFSLFFRLSLYFCEGLLEKKEKAKKRCKIGFQDFIYKQTNKGGK